MEVMISVLKLYPPAALLSLAGIYSKKIFDLDFSKI